MIRNRSNVALILVIGVFAFLCASVAMGAKVQKESEKALSPAAKAAKRPAPAVSEQHIHIEKIFLKKGKVHVKVKNTGKLSVKEYNKGRLVIVNGGRKMTWPLSKVGSIQQFNAEKDLIFNTGLVLKKTANIQVGFDKVRGEKTKQVVSVPLKLAKTPEKTAGTKLGSGPGISAKAKTSGGTISPGDHLVRDKASKHTPRRQLERPTLREAKDDEEGITISRPFWGSRLHAGTPMIVRWEFFSEVLAEYGDSPMPVTVIIRKMEGDFAWTSPPQTDTEWSCEIPADALPGEYGLLARFETESVAFTGTTYFQILPSNDLVLTSPPVTSTRTDTKYVGQRYLIDWNAFGEAAERDYEIKLLHSGDVLHRLIATQAGRTSLYWKIGGDCNSSTMVPSGENYIIKVSTVGNPVYESTSAPFNIELPTIIITPPGNWPLRSRMIISWSNHHVPEGATLKISLLKGGTYFQLIAENVPNTNNYTWEEAGVEPYTGPATNASTAQRVAPPGSDYRIHIEMEDCDLVTAVSNQFSLSE